MKIGILGDTHWGSGYSFGKVDSATQLNTRLLDFIDTFNNIIDKHILEGVQILVLTGDSYDSKFPPPDQVGSFSKCLRRAIDRGIKKIIIVAGNHDRQRNISTTTLDVFKELKIPEIIIYTDIGFHNINKNTHLILVPYRDRRSLGVDNNDDAIQILEKEINEKTKDLKGSKIAVGHFMLERGVSSQDLSPDSFSMNEVIFPIEAFKDYKAVIFGHVHRHEILKASDPAVMYAGSMEKVSFGEKDHQKVSIILDTNDINNFKIINTKTRNLFEINLDYSSESHKKDINEKIFKDIDEFDNKNNIKDAIVKVIIKVQENDLYFVGQPRIKDFVTNKGVKFCSGIYVSTSNSRQLRDDTINESASTIEAMKSFIKKLKESDNMKEKLSKVAEKIIKEAEGK